MEVNGEQNYYSQALTKNQDGKTWRDETEVFVHAHGNHLDQVGRVGRQDGSEPVGSLGTNDSTPNPQCRKILTRSILGKIISRVNDLEARHLAYVEAHEKRLEQRLTESKASKQEAIQLIEEIRELTRILEEMADSEEE